jgi:hypothetical protein
MNDHHDETVTPSLLVPMLQIWFPSNWIICTMACPQIGVKQPNIDLCDTLTYGGWRLPRLCVEHRRGAIQGQINKNAASDIGVSDANLMTRKH